MPNFLVIGSPKSGTTSLYNYLKQHPEIYMSPIKEPHFFAFENQSIKFHGPNDDQAYLSKFSVTSLSEYEKLFDGVTSEKAIGEVSTMYLYLKDSAAKIKYYLPDVKLIAILRNPVDRAFSHFLHLVRDGRENTMDFDWAISQEEKRIKENWSPAWHYQRVGLYAEQIKQYLDIFDRSQIKVYIYDEWQQDNQVILKDIYNFLGVDANYQLDCKNKYNEFSYVPKNLILNQFFAQDNFLKSFIKKIIPKNIYKKLGDNFYQSNLQNSPKMDNATRQKLNALFKDDILKLQEILNIDITNWLQDP